MTKTAEPDRVTIRWGAGDGMGRTLDLRLVLKCKVIRGARNSVENWVRGLACDLTGSVRSGSFRALMHPVRFAAVGHFGCRWIAIFKVRFCPRHLGTRTDNWKFWRDGGTPSATPLPGPTIPLFATAAADLELCRPRRPPGPPRGPVTRH